MKTFIAIIFALAMISSAYAMRFKSKAKIQTKQVPHEDCITAMNMNCGPAIAGQGQTGLMVCVTECEEFQVDECGASTQADICAAVWYFYG